VVPSLLGASLACGGLANDGRLEAAWEEPLDADSTPAASGTGGSGGGRPVMTVRETMDRCSHHA
jgi:hypothetical protein